MLGIVPFIILAAKKHFQEKSNETAQRKELDFASSFINEGYDTYKSPDKLMMYDSHSDSMTVSNLTTDRVSD